MCMQMASRLRGGSRPVRALQAAAWHPAAPYATAQRAALRSSRRPMVVMAAAPDLKLQVRWGDIVACVAPTFSRPAIQASRLVVIN